MTDAVIAQEIQQFVVDAPVELFEIDATALFGEVLRFTPAPLVPDPAAPVPQAVTWGGDVYTPRPCETSGWLWDGMGPLPTPTMKLGNTDLAISALTIAYGDLLGVTVTRHRTFKKFLDGQPDADPDVELDIDVYRIERKVNQNKAYVEFELGTAIDVQGRLIPGRQVLQGFCSRRYRKWNADTVSFDYPTVDHACPYTGANYFTADGTPTADPALDVAPKRLELCCALRFPNQDLPFGGFPGVSRFRQ